MPGLWQRPPLWHPEFPFLLLWSHKSASTALARWFFAQIGSPQLGGVEDEDAIRRYSGLGIHEYQLKVYCRSPGYHRRCHRALRGDLPVVKFVRDPAARAFSGFLAIRRNAVLTRPGFWGARVNREVVARLRASGDAQAAPYSFADFVEWLAQTSPDAQNNHVRAQRMDYEAGRRIEIVPIEDLAAQLAQLEQRFALPRLSVQPGLLDSGHHRQKSGDFPADRLEEMLRVPVPVGFFERQPPPRVDSRRLEGTALGARLREVLAVDYAAYPVY